MKSKSKFEAIQQHFTSIFPNIAELSANALDIGNGNIIPLANFREVGVNGFAPISELSSGMLKVLLILTDIQILPDDSVYILDEYENSLGVNAIDFLPEYWLEYAYNKQPLITSHHPYIINNIPIENWILVNRNGRSISTTVGNVLAEKY